MIMTNISNILKVVVSVYENNSRIVTFQEIEEETKLIKWSISAWLKKLVDIWVLSKLEWTKWFYIKKPREITNKKSLYRLWELTFYDSILTWDSSLELQWVKKEKYSTNIDFMTFTWRDKKIQNEELYYSIFFRKERLKNLKYFQNEIITDYEVTCYSIEKSLLDMIDFQVSIWNKDSIFCEIIETEIHRFDIEKLKELSKYYSEEVKEQLKEFLKNFE